MKLGLRFAAREPYHSWTLEIRPVDFDCNKPPSASQIKTANLIAEAFRNEGWLVDSLGEDTCWPTWFISRQGTGFFNEWTPEEERRFLTFARKILRQRFRITKVPKHRLTLAECL